MNFTQDLLGILCNEKYGEYVGGTLTFKSGEKLVGLNINGEGFTRENGRDFGYFQTLGERALVSLLYLKHKTPEHEFYGAAQQYLNGKSSV